MNRRCLLRVTLAGGLWVALTAHSPYRQWQVYRRTRLVVLASAQEDRSVLLGRLLATFYAQHLPESRATLARARDNNDLVRLMASKQLDVALMREREAHAAFAGEPPHADAGQVPLRALAALGDYLFVARDDLPDASAYMLTETLAQRWKDLDPALVNEMQGPRPRAGLSIPLHPGALEYYRDHLAR